MMHTYPILQRNSPHWYLKNIRSSRDIIITIISMRLAARIGIIIIVLLILAAVWYGYQELQNPAVTERKELMALGCTPTSYDSQGSPTAWSCPSD